MDKMDIKILVATHKQAITLDDDIYYPLFVGKNGRTDILIPGDDTGDHISQKNPNYCELTGLYWGWKNLNCDYLGLVHYRRYFRGKNRSILSNQELLYYLSISPVILPRKRHYMIQTVKEHYCSTHDPMPLLETEKIIQEKYPKMMPAYNTVMNQRSACMWNIFIMKKSISDEYCKWLFEILGELETRIDLSRYNAFQARVFGRISELLLNVWMEYKQYRYLELPVMNTEGEHWARKGVKYLKCLISKQPYES